MTSASASPKRKRGQETHLETRVILSQQLFAHDVDEEDTGSPRTKVARKFDGLEIDNDLFTLQHNHTSSSPRPCQTAQLSATSADATSGRSIDAKSMMPTQPPSTSSPAVAGNAQSISAASLATKSRSGSPPLAGELSDQFWHDSEITGHDPDPDDPDDDLYGINGVGFRPTAAIAWSRSRRRKQQLEEYKNREAREARQQRSERRKRGISDSEDVPSLDNSPRKSVRVHFEDG
ncbi:hypothetical protein PV08_09460 [Exophiala spinifera]|uniref:Uncharacterized protein n=1 Tax=Exophiala spinifera TaxID=91928 RepID=A0A0D2BLW7_9EURO|nr:uncharacterized protein PV08_09460 [Exophiala spinifera]KIW12184.1 hypothetical protein PV08_09460 [Exophiala spinifera]